MNTVYDQVKNRSIETLKDLVGKKVALRIDVNTSLGENNSVDPGEDWRIIKAFRSIDFLVQQGASVIVISHLGKDGTESLRPVFEYMNEHRTMGFVPRFDKELMSEMMNEMKNGSVLMLENLRSCDGELANDSRFLDALVDACDLYVNDAFSVSHRRHASVDDITRRLPAYFGLQFVDEVRELGRAKEALASGKAVLLLGGAKFGTKLTLLEKFLPEIEYALVGGALANVFLKERGFEIGKSFADTIDISAIRENEKIILPIDVVDQEGDILSIDEVGESDVILDIGPETEKLFENIIDGAKSIIWNGPMGKYEDGYVAGSVAMAKSIAHAKAFSVTGGGDTATVLREENVIDGFDFVSTGGGAMLDFMIEGTLPGIEAIINKKQA